MVIIVSKKLFIVTNLGNSTYSPRVKYEFHANEVFLSQSFYLDRIINATNISAAKQIWYPLQIAYPLYKKTNSTIARHTRENGYLTILTNQDDCFS